MTKQRNYDLDTVKGRLRAFLHSEHITQAEFAERLGVSPTYVGAMRRGLSVDKLQRVSEAYPQLNREWLLYGEGEMLNKPAGKRMHRCDDERGKASVPDVNGSADDDVKISVKESAADIAAGAVQTSGNLHVAERLRGVVEVPLLPVQAFAGNLQSWSKPVLLRDCEKIVSPVAPVDFAIRISGDSMEPEFADGTTLFLRRITDRNFMPWGHPVVIDSSNGVIFKLIYPPEEDDNDAPYIIARSLNPRYPPLRIETDTILGIYRVCASIRIYNTL